VERRTVARVQRKVLATLVLLVVAVVLVGAGVLLVSRGGDEASSGEGITVRDAWTAPNQDLSAVYLTIDNHGAADRLVGASTAEAAVVSLMGGAAEVTHAAEGTAPIDLEVPAGTTELRPGSGHLMLQQLSGPLQPGDKFPMQLTFERTGRIDVEVEVVTWDEAASRSH
jgi:copper(I)-binding protein